MAGSPERNALDILRHLPLESLNRLKATMKLGVPGVIGPTTLQTFVRLMASRGFDLSEEGVNAFKDSHGLGNSGVVRGVVGPQTAGVYFEVLTRQAPAGRRRIHQAGLDLIKEFEGLHRVVGPDRVQTYLDPVGVPTIGYGHTGPEARPGHVISFRRAEELLLEDLARFEEGVVQLVEVPLNENQFAALVSFAFNLGLGALGESTLLRLLNQGDYGGAEREFGRWVFAGGQRLEGLARRREADVRGRGVSVGSTRCRPAPVVTRPMFPSDGTTLPPPEGGQGTRMIPCGAYGARETTLTGLLRPLHHQPGLVAQVGHLGLQRSHLPLVLRVLRHGQEGLVDQIPRQGPKVRFQRVDGGARRCRAGLVWISVVWCG